MEPLKGVEQNYTLRMGETAVVLSAMKQPQKRHQSRTKFGCYAPIWFLFDTTLVPLWQQPEGKARHLIRAT